MRAAASAGLNAVLGTQISTNTPLMSVGLDSIAAVEFASAVSGELGVGFSAVMLFDHPTLDSIVSYLAEELEQDLTEGRVDAQPMDGTRRSSRGANDKPVRVFLAGVSFEMGGSARSEAGLRELVARAHTTPSSVPAGRWAAAGADAPPAAGYGSFLDAGGL